jgi:hypothetical protein
MDICASSRDEADILALEKKLKKIKERVVRKMVFAS